MIRFSVHVLVCAGLLTLVGVVRAQEGSTPVRVQVRGKVFTSVRGVKVGDLALMEGGSPKLRDAMENLELDRFSSSERRSITFTKSQLKFRLLLAGFPQSGFRLEGAKRVVVTFLDQDVTAKDVGGAALQELQRRLPWKPEEIEIRQMGEIQVPPLRLKPTDHLTLEATLRPAGSLLGRSQVDVSIVSDGRILSSVLVDFEVQLYQQVAVVLRRIERGEALTKENVKWDRRPMNSSSRYLTFQPGLLGQQAKRLLQPGEILRTADVVAPVESAPILIQARDRVRMVVRLGNYRVVAVGEALQSGKEGDWIRLRNVTSRAVVRGRVRSAGEVEVGFQ